jgi:hypothetical protein
MTLMRVIALAASASFALALAATPLSAATFYLTTGVGTHETTIDANTPASWTFYVEDPLTRWDGGVFALKHGPGTTFGIRLDLIEFSTSDILSSVTYADVTAYLGAGGSSEFEKFIFLVDTVGYGLTQYTEYTVALSLVDDGIGNADNQSYVVRGMADGAADRVFADPDTILVTAPAPSVTATPEPASAFILGAGLLAIGLTRRGRSPAGS